MELTVEQRAELRAMVSSSEVSAVIATRARIVLWRAEGRQKQEVAALAGVSRPTVDLWLPPVRRRRRRRVARSGSRSGAGTGAGCDPARILAVTRTSPPAETGLSPVAAL
jgi:hypothetical protein